MSVTRNLGCLGAAFAFVCLVSACGEPPQPVVPVTNVPPPSAAPSAEPDDAAATVPPASATKPKKAAGAGGPGSSKEDPVMRCGPRDSYIYVADYQCPDGSRPLGSDPRAGSAARRGNVGANSKGHIIDLYVIPCEGAKVEVYVDMYGCPEYEKMILGN